MDLPPGWQRHRDATDTWLTAPDGSPHWTVPLCFQVEHLAAYLPAGADADPAHLVACALHTPLVAACLAAVGGAGDAALGEAALAWPHLPAVRAAWRVVEAARAHTGAVRARQEAEAAALRARLEAEAAARTFPCPVCLEDAPLASRVALPRCGDALCRPCLRAALSVQLAARPRASHFACPFGPQGCAAPPAAPLPNLGFPSSDALAAALQVEHRHPRALHPPDADGGVLARRWELARNARLIPCPAPHCAAGYALRPSRQAGWVATCQHCGTDFCALHGLHHAMDPADPAAACQAHAAALEAAAPADPRALAGTVPCPGCHAPSFRISGCDHMRCTQCDTPWCWACGGVRSLVQQHQCTPRRPPPPSLPAPGAAAALVAVAAEPTTAPAAPRLSRCRQVLQWGSRCLQRAHWLLLQCPKALSLPLALLQLALYATIALLHTPFVLLSLLYFIPCLCRCYYERFHGTRFRYPLLHVHTTSRELSLRAVLPLAEVLAITASLGLPQYSRLLQGWLTALLIGRRQRLQPPDVAPPEDCGHGEPWRVPLWRVLRPNPAFVPAAPFIAPGALNRFVEFDRHNFSVRIDIGVFGHQEGEGSAWLQEACLPSPPPPRAAVARAARAAGGCTSGSPSCTMGTVEVLPRAVRQALVQAVEAAWRSSSSSSSSAACAAGSAAALQGSLARSVASGSRAHDFKLLLTAQELEVVIGARALAALTAALQQPPHAIALRRTQAQGEWIAFHTDHAARTVNVPLEEAGCTVGGALVFATAAGELLAAPRTPGCLLAHDGDLAHGVTRLTQGVRYGLFLLRGRE